MARLFVAVDLPPSARSGLEPVLRSLVALGLDANLVPVNQTHLTLAFLGERPDAFVDRYARALSTVRADPFEVELAGLGFFPSAARANVVWAGVSAGSESLVSLSEQVRRAIGVEADSDAVPHVTLARLKTWRGLDGLQAYAAGMSGKPLARFQVDSLVLKRSVYDGGRHRYFDVARVPLTRS